MAPSSLAAFDEVPSGSVLAPSSLAALDAVPSGKRCMWFSRPERAALAPPTRARRGRAKRECRGHAPMDESVAQFLRDARKNASPEVMAKAQAAVAKVLGPRANPDP